MATIQENLAGLFKRGEAQVFCLQIDICHDNGGMMMIMIYVMMIINIIITTMPRCGQGTSMLSLGKITPRLAGQPWLRYYLVKLSFLAPYQHQHHNDAQVRARGGWEKPQVLRSTFTQIQLSQKILVLII